MADLKESWAVTMRHLAASRFYLPKELAFEEAIEAEKEYLDYLHHNEFKLAMEAADQMGIMNNAPNEFWRELELAAKNMGLESEAKRFRDIQNA